MEELTKLLQTSLGGYSLSHILSALLTLLVCLVATLAAAVLIYALAEEIGLTYTGADNAEHRPVLIHRALLGSFERFIAILLEHYAGAFPLWLAPVQAIVQWFW